MSDTVRHIVSSIEPFDDLERAHRSDALAWIDSGAPLYRTAPPDEPPKHLVAYFVVFDVERRGLLLGDHRKAGLWLPSGGHVDVDEHPADTVRRELREELALDAVLLYPEPLLITVTETVGRTAGHTDVSLWYVVAGDARSTPWHDPHEYREVRWFDVGSLPSVRCEPHLERFVTKLERRLGG